MTIARSLVIAMLIATPTASTRADEPGTSDYELPTSAFERWRPPADFDTQRFRAAIAAYRQGTIEAGDALAAGEHDPCVRAALEWVAIRFAKAGLGSARLEAFLAAEPSFPMAGWIHRRIETALYDERRGPAATRAAFAMRAPETAAGRIALAGALKADGDLDDAKALLREAWRDNTLGAGLEVAIQRLMPEAIRPDDLRFRAERLVFRRTMGEALRVAAPLGPGYAALLRALDAALDDRAEAAALIEAVPSAERTRAVFALSKATLLRRADKLADAALTLRAVPRDAELVSPEEWWTERRTLARKLLDAGDATTAYAVASAYRATTDATRIEAEFYAGWIALRFLGDGEAASVHFTRAAGLARTPLSLSRGHYWLGRARDTLLRPADEAYREAARYGATFYGQLAAERLHIAALPLRTTSLRDADRRAFEVRTGTRVIRLLMENGARDLAVPLALDEAQTLPDASSVAALADLVAGYRDANLLLMLAKAASQRGFAVDRYAFPLFGVPAFEPVEGSAERAIVYAIARQESAFDPKAVSRAGARGLMQMMPATAAATARQFSLPFALPQLTGEPAANARLGAAHLGHLLQSLGGSYALVFAGYNAGAGRVKQWIAAYGDPRDPEIDMIDWIERIPISETRNYVQRVMENVQVYRALLRFDERLGLGADLARGRRLAGDPIATGAMPRRWSAGLAGR